MYVDPSAAYRLHTDLDPKQHPQFLSDFLSDPFMLNLGTCFNVIITIIVSGLVYMTFTLVSYFLCFFGDNFLYSICWEVHSVFKSALRN